MQITIMAFGPEIAALLERESILSLEDSSTFADLVDRLEDDIKTRYGWAPGIMHSGFQVLINGRLVETLTDTRLKDGDRIVILSPIGGG